MASPFENITSPDHFKQVIKSNPFIVVHFWAEWCEPCKQMNEVCYKLSEKHSNAKIILVEAEEQSDISEAESIESVPTFIIFKNGSKEATIEGANVPLLTSKVEELIKGVPSSTTSSTSTPTVDLNTRLQQLITSAPAILFMKGSPEQPQCGFSSKIVNILKGDKITFNHFNILADSEVREGLKKYSNWPTYPQLYFDGKLVGGLDIVKELSEEGELRTMAPPEAMRE